MTTPPIDAVVAGTKGFALALLAPIAERVGARPRVAADPAHALVYCTGPAGIVVVEFLGEDSLSAIKDLVLEGGGVRIVAAVPLAHAAAEGPLRALGVDAVRWDGTPDVVMGAVERQIAFAMAPPPPRPAARPAPAAAAAKAAPPAAPSRPPAAAPAPSKPLAAVARPAAAPTLTPSRPAPAVARPAAPAAPAHTPTRPLPAVAAPRPAAAPALTPSKPVPAVPRAAAPAAPAHTPTKPLAAVVAPRPAAAGPALTPSRPLAAVAPPAPPEDDHLFDAFDEELLAATESLGAPPPTRSAPAPARSAPPSAAPAPAGAGAPWPTAVPGAVEAADALGRALVGDVAGAGAPLAVVADVLAALSELERAVLSGRPQPFDTDPVRRAAVMRVRVAVALATSPAPGVAVDQAAVSAFLADIDALLSDVNALAAEAPTGVHASLEAMRNALVKEAIDFSEVVQRAAPAEAFAPAPAVARAPTGRAAEARLLSVSTAAEQEADAGEAKRHRRMFVVLGIAVAAAVAFHGYRYVLRMRGGVEPPTRSSAPAGAFVVAGPRSTDPTVVRSKDGKPFTREELSRMIEEERLKGSAVKEIGPGVVLITPAPQPAAGNAR